MGSDSGTIADDSRKKHRRSSDGEAEETTKRRKHRHHHHRHHRHHHRSKKREEDDRGVEDEVEMEVGELPMAVAELKKDYDDMEEGEIVEEDGEKLETYNLLAVNSPDSAGFLRGQMYQTDGDRKKVNKLMDNDLSSLRGGVNGNDVVTISDSSDEKYKKSIRSLHQSGSPDGLRFSRISGSNHPIDRSGSQSRSDVENVDSLRIPQLQDWNKDRKTSRKYANDSDEEIRFQHDDSEHFEGSRGKTLEDERESSVYYSSHTDRQDSKYAKDTSHRYLDDGDVDRVCRHERVRGSSRDEKREKEIKKSRSRDHGKERSRGIDREENKQMEFGVDGKVLNGTESKMATDWDMKRGREREKSVDISRHRGKVTAIDKITGNTLEWDRHRYTEVVDMHMERERNQRRNKEKEKEREQERSVERARDRDRARQRDISLERSRDRKTRGNDSEGKTKDWSTERDRDNERVRDRSDDRGRERRREGSYRERENGRGRSRDRYWDTGHHKYDGASSKQDRRSEYKHDDNSHSHNQDRRKTENPSRVDHSTNSARDSEDTRKREEEEHEEYEEKISLQLAKEEEDDVERIKEESRRRRQAILEKYKNMKLQDQSEPQSGNDHEKLPILETEPLISISDKSSESLDVAKSPVERKSDAEHTSSRGLGEGTPKSERSDDMFCDDIFGETPTGGRKRGKGDDLPVVRSGLHDNWDDAEGYYSYRFGELLDGRYEITAAHGKGVFSSVVRAKDLKAGPGEPEEVAIKIIRNNETMFKAGQSELIILKKLVGADPEDRRHCVRFLSSFKYRNHLCLVFESLNMNLREVLKKFGRNIGLKLTAVRAYAKQLLIALKHLRNCGVLHCDIKPDNMLVNESKNVLKLCDFGNAMFAGKNEITPYLVSRFYRAPEIILGLTYDHPVDIWSIGCCLYELYTGKVLFPGATNNDMLRLHLELKGPFPKKMLRKGAFIEQHFDQDLNFISLEDDPVTKKTVKRVLVNIKPKDIGSIIAGSAGEDPKMLTNFKDLLDKIFTLDPDKRMTVSQALAHPFITGK